MLRVGLGSFMGDVVLRARRGKSGAGSHPVQVGLRAGIGKLHLED